MRAWTKCFLLATLVAAIPGWAGAQQATQATSAVDQVVDRITAREQKEVATIRQYSPLIETYIQDMKPDQEMGSIPVKDHYFIGLADFGKGVVDHSLLDATPKGGLKGKLNPEGPLAHVSDFFNFSSSYDPTAFLDMVFVDANGFDRSHYHFEYVRREFLGEVKCLVFDVTPLPHSGKGRFKGRIWANDQDYTIVRFNGVYTPIASYSGYNVHFDSWRINMQPGLWLPAYIYSQETSLKEVFGGNVRFRSQTRLWGYNLRGAGHESDFTELTVEAPGAIQDQAQASQDPTPVEAERTWQHEAEDNVLDRLQRSGLIATPGSVDKILATVVNNIEVTNNIDIQPEIRCRVLLTSTLESFSIGHTIVLSRGLLDVLPDEASLATMLAQEMGTIIVTKPEADQWGFNDLTNVSTTEVLQRLSFRDTPHDAELANQKAIELLKNSPYKDKLAVAGLFLKQLDAEQKALPSLINPKLGNSVFFAQSLINAAPQLQPAKLDQIAALPLGARIKLDPWSDKVEMVTGKPVALFSEREKMPFEVTPFAPFLTYYTKAAVEAPPPAKADVAKTQPDVAQPVPAQPQDPQPQPQQ
ncbi:MAG: hypothetical protein WCA98_10255 [Candidatus Acidiferrales bacterium]